MSTRRDLLKLTGTAAALAFPAAMAAAQAPVRNVQGRFDVRSFGATGDGKTLDTAAINKAIEAAAVAGGTVLFPAGNYLSYSIHLRSGVGLYLDHGAVLIAADPLPPGRPGGYDEPEPVQPWEAFQDYGHNHWHNSLLWGENLHDLSITGPGRIWGRGLFRSNGAGQVNSAGEERTQGVGNKTIALKNCRNVLLRDFQILQGGWFGLLATGVDNLTIDNLTIDTQRDGLDIDCCRNVRVSNCIVNSPFDDAIVPKSSFSLGYNRSTENLTITNCYVTGQYRVGTLLDGTFQLITDADKFEHHGIVGPVPKTGRIKFGTESNGGFKNITVTNCVFEGCQGLAIESEDGAIVEDMTISNITMRDVVTCPIFIRLGARKRGPAASTKVGAIRRVLISNIVSSNSDARLGAGIVSGVPGFEIENVRLSNIYIQHKGGGTAAQAALNPPENEANYPDPGMFGDMPSSGFFVRHAGQIEFDHVEIATQQPDARPCFVLSDVQGAEFSNIKAPAGQPVYKLEQVTRFSSYRTRGVPDVELTKADQKAL